jgi:pimeloyl-ACP methyl ester carboxylesterase
MLTIALRILVGLLVVYAVAMLVAWRFQDRFAFPGPTGPLPPPADYGMPDGRIVTVATSDSVTLRGWYLPPNPSPGKDRTAPGLLWFYGNMETIGEIAPILSDFRPPGTAMLVIDYRGYGQSSGRPSERGVYRDAQAAWTYLSGQPDVDSTRIAIYGRSIGSAVALYLATERPAAAVILESAFTSGKAMAKKHYALVPTSLLTLRLNNLERARRLDVPVLSFHGTDDWIAPIEMGRAVAEAGRAEGFVTFEGAGHNDTYAVGGEAYRQRFHDFLARHIGGR